MKFDALATVAIGLGVGLILFGNRSAARKQTSGEPLDENGDPYMRMWTNAVGKPVAGGYSGGLGLVEIYGNPYK